MQKSGHMWYVDGNLIYFYPFLNFRWDRIPMGNRSSSGGGPPNMGGMGDMLRGGSNPHHVVHMNSGGPRQAPSQNDRFAISNPRRY